MTATINARILEAVLKERNLFAATSCEPWARENKEAREICAKNAQITHQLAESIMCRERK